MITSDCECKGASSSQKKEKLKANVTCICKGEYNPAFNEVDEETVKQIKSIALEVFDGTYLGVTFKLADSKIDIISMKEDKVKVKRQATRMEVAEM